MDKPHYYFSIGGGDVYRAEKKEDGLKKIYQYFKEHPYSKISAYIHYWDGKKTTKTTAATIISVQGKKVIAYEPLGYARPLREIKSNGKLGKKIGIEYYRDQSGFVTKRIFYWMKG